MRASSALGAAATTAARAAMGRRIEKRVYIFLTVEVELVELVERR